MAAILTVAMVVVIGTSVSILFFENQRHQRHPIFYGSPELWAFAATGIVVVVILWTMMVVQWWRI